LKKNNPIRFFLNHQETILTAFEQNQSSPKRSWEILNKTLPELKMAMSQNTFKQYISVFSLVIKETGRVRQKLDNKELEIKKLFKKISQLEFKLDGVKAPISSILSVRHKLDNNPNRIEGWNVRQSKDGYYRCYRKIDKKLYSIYIGKTLNQKIVRP